LSISIIINVGLLVHCTVMLGIIRPVLFILILCQIIYHSNSSNDLFSQYLLPDKDKKATIAEKKGYLDLHY